MPFVRHRSAGFHSGCKKKNLLVQLSVLFLSHLMNRCTAVVCGVVEASCLALPSFVLFCSRSLYDIHQQMPYLFSNVWWGRCGCIDVPFCFPSIAESIYTARGASRLAVATRTRFAVIYPRYSPTRSTLGSFIVLSAVTRTKCFVSIQYTPASVGPWTQMPDRTDVDTVRLDTGCECVATGSVSILRRIVKNHAG